MLKMIKMFGQRQLRPIVMQHKVCVCVQNGSPIQCEYFFFAPFACLALISPKPAHIHTACQFLSKVGCYCPLNWHTIAMNSANVD